MTPKSVLQLKILPLAAQAIVDQARYYEFKQDIRLAERWEAAVKQAILSLRTSPERGSLCRFSALSLDGVRRLPIPQFQKYLLFYQFVHGTNTLIVINVLHGARDLEPLLSQSLS
jgi:plasmid stabilization system protein ParE